MGSYYFPGIVFQHVVVRRSACGWRRQGCEDLQDQVRAVPRCREGWRTQAGPEPGRTLWTTQRNNGWIQLLQGQHRRQGYVGRGYVVRLPAEPEEVHAGNENSVCGTEEAAGARRSDRLHEGGDGVRKRAQQANV